LSSRVAELTAQLQDKKTVEAGLSGFGSFFGEEGAKAAPFAVKVLPQLVEKVGDKDKKVATAAAQATKAAVATTSPYAVSLLIPSLLAGLGNKAKPAQKEVCLGVIAALAQSAPQQLGQELIDIVSPISDLMNDIKKEVKTAAAMAMEAVCSCTGNKDIEPFIPMVIRANQDMKSVPECVEALAGCVFVQNVEAPVLAVTTPVLQRGLNERNEEIKRKCCVIVDNMCKLVEDPKDVAPLMPRLQPLVAKVKDSMADPEARSMAERSYETLMKAAGDSKCVDVKAERESVRARTFELVQNSDSDAVAYAAGIAASLAEVRAFEPEVWASALGGLFDDAAWVELLRVWTSITGPSLSLTAP